MRTLCFLASAFLFPGVVGAQPVEVGGYVMSQGAIEVTRETFGFDGTTLSDTVDFPSRGIRMESVARYAIDYSPLSYELMLYSGSGETPVQQVDVSFTETSASWSTRTEFGDSTGVTPLEGPYAFLQNLVFAHLAVVLLQYDHEAAGNQTLNVWMPEQAAVLPMEIEFTSGTDGTVSIAGTLMNVEVDAAGWLRRAAVPSQDVSVEWIEGT